MLKLLITLTVLVCCLSAAEDVCLLDSEEMTSPLQVAFVIDQTVVSESRSVWTLFQNETIHHLMPDLSKRFSGTQFAVTAFAYFAVDAKPYSNEELDKCFTTTVKFTRDHSQVISNVNALKQLTNLYTEYWWGGFYAMMSTAAHLDLGWDYSDNIRKVMVLFTNRYPYDHFASDSDPRTPPKGDGTDTCRTSLPPNFRGIELEQTLSNLQLLVVVVYLKDADDDFLYFDAAFGMLYIPYIRFVIPNESSFATADILQKYDYSCKIYCGWNFW